MVLPICEYRSRRHICVHPEQPSNVLCSYALKHLNMKYGCPIKKNEHPSTMPLGVD